MKSSEASVAQKSHIITQAYCHPRFSRIIMFRHSLTLVETTIAVQTGM